jgi:hypothetical protein
MQLELSPRDREFLVDVVDRALREVRVEVRRTSTPNYRDDLRREESRLERLLERLQGLPVA